MTRTLVGIAKGVLAALALHALVAWVRPQPRTAHALDEGTGRIREVLLHYAPSADFVKRTYREFLAWLPRDVKVYVAVEKAEHAAEFTREFGREATPIVVGKPITTWSRDRFVAGDDGSVVVPSEPHPGPPERVNDCLVPFALARVTGRDARVAPFRFDGGDFLATGGCVIASCVWARRNPEWTTTELITSAERLFGEQVVYLPEAPEHHVGMAIAPVGKDHVLVGDARWGGRLAPDLADADRSEETARQFDAVASRLEAAGFTVDRIPVVPTTTPYVWRTYTNGLFEDGVVYLPTYGVAALDHAAAEVYRGLGFEVRPVDASGVYVQGGTLHCLVHVLRRG